MALSPPHLRKPERISRMASACQYASAHKLKIIQIRQAYQAARTGQKCFVTVLGGKRKQDAWFHHQWPPAGTSILVDASIAYGPHHQRKTLYVSKILDSFPPEHFSAYWRWRRGMSIIFWLACLCFLFEWLLFLTVLLCQKLFSWLGILGAWLGNLVGSKFPIRASDHKEEKSASDYEEPLESSLAPTDGYHYGDSNFSDGGVTIRPLSAEQLSQLYEDDGFRQSNP